MEDEEMECVISWPAAVPGGVWTSITQPWLHRLSQIAPVLVAAALALTEGKLMEELALNETTGKPLR